MLCAAGPAASQPAELARARSAYNQQQFDSAFTWYNAVLEKYPQSPIVPEAMEAVRFSLGAAGRGREAIAVIDTFMARNPDRLPADSLAYRKGMIIFDEGAYAEAIPMFMQVVTQYPESPVVPDAMFQIGLSHEYLAQIDSAPAGAGIVGTLFTVFVILLVTDILGLTKVFPFTRPIR